MKILHVFFIVGAGGLLLCVLRPYLLLDAGWVIVLMLLVCVVTGATVWQSPADGSSAERIMATAVPWLFTAVLLANGALDDAPEELHHTSIVDTYYAETWDRVAVQSWRPGRQNETLYLMTTLFHPGKFHYRGDAIVVGVKPGAFGLPWVSSLKE